MTKAIQLLVILAVAILGFSSAAFATAGIQNNPAEKIAVLPFREKDVSREQAELAREKFVEILQSLSLYEVLKRKEMDSVLTDANVADLQTCDYSLCLADIGKVLGVKKILFASISRRGRLYALKVRVINVENADIVYDDQRDYSGEITDFLSTTIPDAARQFGERKLQSGTPWYVVTAAAVLFVGVVYMLYKSFDQNSTVEGSTGTGPPIPQ